jgi:hypothetical protein
VTMTLGIQRPDTKAEVILGVDTHTWTSTRRRWPWTIWAEKPGRVERANERKGLREATLCWAEGLGSVRCAGIEGTSSYGALSSPAT